MPFVNTYRTLLKAGAEKKLNYPREAKPTSGTPDHMVQRFQKNEVYLLRRFKSSQTSSPMARPTENYGAPPSNTQAYRNSPASHDCLNNKVRMDPDFGPVRVQQRYQPIFSDSTTGLSVP